MKQLSRPLARICGKHCSISLGLTIEMPHMWNRTSGRELFRMCIGGWDCWSEHSSVLCFLASTLFSLVPEAFCVTTRPAQTSCTSSQASVVSCLPDGSHPSGYELTHSGLALRLLVIGDFSILSYARGLSVHFLWCYFCSALCPSFSWGSFELSGLGFEVDYSAQLIRMPY